MTPSVDYHLTTAAAGAALTTPMWLPSLNTWGQLLLWVMGVAWLTMQMYFKIKKENK